MKWDQKKSIQVLENCVHREAMKGIKISPIEIDTETWSIELETEGGSKGGSLVND